MLWPEVDIMNIRNRRLFHYCTVFVGPYVFILYMLFHLNAGDDNDDVRLT